MDLVDCMMIANRTCSHITEGLSKGPHAMEESVPIYRNKCSGKGGTDAMEA